MTSIDLEKELTCPICTDLLYQPLTLLDCLHTFCGSCLKEWFKQQKLKYEQNNEAQIRARRKVDFSCPSCRSNVRETRPNATVTTLLEMYLNAHPDKQKSMAEKEELLRIYRPGDLVLPFAPHSNRRQRVESNILVAESGNDLTLLTRTRGLRLDEGQREPNQLRLHNNLHSQHAVQQEQSPNGARTSHVLDQQSDSERRAQNNVVHQVSHQSSLRSLLSNSDLRSEQMTAEIIQQIVDEGLLDGIELDHLTGRQEEELSEMIAEAYRRRHRSEHLATRSSPTRSRNSSNVRQLGPADHALAETSISLTAPGLRTGFSGDLSSEPGNHNPSSAETRWQHEQGTVTSVSYAGSDPSLISQSREVRTDRSSQPPHGTRSSTDSSPRRISDMWARGVSVGQEPAAPRSTGENTGPPQQTSTGNLRAATEGSILPLNKPLTRTSELVGSSPSVTCSSCGKTHIELQLYYTCSKCTRGSEPLALCVSCYRKGVGCDHWYGFRRAVEMKYARASLTDEPPHVLKANKILIAKEVTHQSGFFCDNCLENANDFFWQCDTCNDGEWGYCQRCVNKAQHCTHPLLPVFHDVSSNEGPSLRPLSPSTYCNLCHREISSSTSRLHCPACNDGDFDICNACYRNWIYGGELTPENGLQGWRKCTSGHRMLIVGFEDRVDGRRRVVVEDVVGGWAMSKGVERSDALNSQEPRWAWRDETDGEWKQARVLSSHDGQDPTQFLPKGSFGFRMVALWSRVPDDGVRDELLFPRGAVITEVTLINEEWGFGYYCRRGGLFPSNFTRPLRPLR